MVLGGTWSVWSSSRWYWVIVGQHFMVLCVVGQYRAILVGTWWYWVRMERNCLILGGTGTV